MAHPLDQYVEAVLQGASMGSQAKAAGVNINTLRRQVLKHPDYVVAKAQGRLYAKGGAQPAGTAPADPEVLNRAMEMMAAGQSGRAASEATGLGLTTVLKHFHRRYPDKVLPMGPAGGPPTLGARIEAARLSVARCEEALAAAKKRLEVLLEGSK